MSARKKGVVRDVLLKMCGGATGGIEGGAVGRAPTGGPRLRRLEPSSPSILISSDLPLPCFTPLPSVLI